MPIESTADIALVKTFHREQKERKMDALVAQSVAELELAQADLHEARRLADIASGEEFDARCEKDRLTRQYAEDIRAVDRLIGLAQVTKNHMIAMSHEERRARGQLQNTRERLAEMMRNP